MRSFSGVFARGIVWFRWLVLPLVLAAAASAIYGGQNLRFTNDYRYFFSPENPNLAAFDKVQRTYTRTDELIWVLKPNEGAATTPEMFKLIGEVTEAAWQTPFSVRVDSLTNYQHTTAEEDDLIVADLVSDPSNVSLEEAERARSIAMSEPATALRLISEDGSTTAVLATLQMPDDDPAALLASIAHARAMKAEFSEAYPDVTIALTGSVALSNAFTEATQKDLSTLVPLMFLILALSVFALTRSASGTFAALIVVGLSAAAALGTAGWLKIPLSPPSSMAPVIILTVAVADSIHILITTLVEMRHGKAKREAIVESLRVNMSPVFLTSVTTAIGFASLNFSDSPPLRDMGTISAVGALYAWVFSMTLFPALLMMLPLKAGKVVENQSALLTKFAEPVIFLRVPLILVFVGIIVASGIRLPQLQFNDRFVEYFDSSIEFRQDSDFAADNLTGIYQLNYSVGAKDSGGIADPAYLERLEAFANWMRGQPEVVHVASFTDIMKRVNKSMHGDDETWYRLPDDRQLAAQYLLLYEMSLPYGLDLNNQINVDKSATRMVVTLTDISTGDLKQLQTRTQAWMADNVPDYMVTAGAGQVVMFSYIGRSNFETMKVGTSLALILISLCLVLALRDLRLGALSLVPNITPPLVAFGIFSLFASELGFWSNFVVAASLGLIVDATVHFLSKYQRARKENNLDERDAVRYAFRTVGTALLVTTLVLVAGFSVLALSAFKINAMLGITVALTVGVALIIDFLLLPGLLVTLDKRRPKATITP